MSLSIYRISSEWFHHETEVPKLGFDKMTSSDIRFSYGSVDSEWKTNGVISATFFKPMPINPEQFKNCDHRVVRC